MNIIEIINKKRLNDVLSKEEINYVINSFIKDEIKDYQMSALLMAITINGMNFDETLFLTDAMLKSGDRLDFSGIDGLIVDKHSTGGIGDKVTLILAPLLASLNIKVAKMSGRSLGYTGGTIDKLESIKNFNVNLSNTDFMNQVNEINLAIASPSSNLDIADKKIYALRDVTATVSSIPLIASSIMSKKLASNADFIVIDIKIGAGALIKTKKEAIKLAHVLINIGKHYQKNVSCILTNMNQPLGYAIGNGLEIKESIDALNGNGAKDLMEVVYSIASIIISKAKNIDLKSAFNEAYQSIQNKKAYNKFLEFVARQNGDIKNIEVANDIEAVISDETGYIIGIDADKIGKLVLELGALRLNSDDIIDHSVGIVLSKKVGDFVTKGEVLGRIYKNKKSIDLNDFKECFTFDKTYNNKDKTIYGMIEDVK